MQTEQMFRFLRIDKPLYLTCNHSVSQELRSSLHISKYLVP